MRYCRVVRFIPKRAAAPFGPPSTQFASSRARRLQVQRYLADLIEEQRAAIRDLETSNFLRDGAGERALLVPKQFAFEHSRPHSRTSPI